MPLRIRNRDEHEEVLARIQQLRTSPASIAEASELKELLEAADEWDRTAGGEAAGEHDDLAALAVQTGSGFALAMARRFPKRDWVAELADLLGKDRNYVEWHLQHDVMPPDDILAAATRLIAGKSPAKRAAAEPGLRAPMSTGRSGGRGRRPGLHPGDEAIPARKAHMPRSMLNILLSGSAVSLATSLVLSLLARAEGRSGVQPVNSTSHWYWGEAAARSRRIDASHTLVGFATHHGASLFWAAVYEMLRRRHPNRAALGDAAAVSAVAAFVDYLVVPRRLTPGWEKAVSPQAIGIAYVVMALALAASPAWPGDEDGARPNSSRTG